MKNTFAKVLQERCIACGLCQLKAPELFDYDHAGIASYRPDKNTGQKPITDPKDLIAFKLAYTACPTGAIVRSDHPFSA